jgi:hypothetical protein
MARKPRALASDTALILYAIRGLRHSLDLDDRGRPTMPGESWSGLESPAGSAPRRETPAGNSSHRGTEAQRPSRPRGCSSRPSPARSPESRVPSPKSKVAKGGK